MWVVASAIPAIWWWSFRVCTKHAESAVWWWSFRIDAEQHTEPAIWRGTVWVDTEPACCRRRRRRRIVWIVNDADSTFWRRIVWVESWTAAETTRDWSFWGTAATTAAAATIELVRWWWFVARWSATGTTAAAAAAAAAAASIGTDSVRTESAAWVWTVVTGSCCYGRSVYLGRANLPRNDH